MKITYNEVIKDIRQICRNIGVTFKRADHDRNGMAAYIFVSSATGLTIHNGSFNLWRGIMHCRAMSKTGQQRRWQNDILH